MDEEMKWDMGKTWVRINHYLNVIFTPPWVWKTKYWLAIFQE